MFKKISNEKFHVAIPHAKEISEERNALMEILNEHKKRVMYHDTVTVEQDNVSFNVNDLRPDASTAIMLIPNLKKSQAIFIMAKDLDSLQTQYSKISGALPKDKKVRIYFLDMNSVESHDSKFQTYLKENKIESFPYNQDLSRAEFVKYLQKAYENYHADNKPEVSLSDNPGNTIGFKKT